MKIFYFCAAIFIIVLIYFFSSLVPLPWFVYPPFILIFFIAFYWDKMSGYLPFNMPDIRRYFTLKSKQRTDDYKKSAKPGKRI